METETYLLNIMVEGEMPKRSTVSTVFADALIEYAEAIKEDSESKPKEQELTHIGRDVSKFKSSSGCTVKVIFGSM